MKQWRTFGILVFASMVTSAWALEPREGWYSVYLGGNKVGYSVSRETPGSDGTVKVDSETFMKIALMDTPMEIVIKTNSVVDAVGRPKSLRYEMTSNGRSQIVNATFGATTISVKADNSGQETVREIKIPQGARLVDDVTGAVMRDGAVDPKASGVFHVLDPSTLTLIENKVRAVGQVTTDIRGVKASAQLIEITDPRAVTRIFVSNKGDILKVEGALGLVMLPDTAESAKDLSKVGLTDLGALNALVPQTPIENAWHTERLTLKISGVDLSRLPNEPGHWVRREQDSWLVTIAPPNANKEMRATHERRALSIAQAAQKHPAWTKPGLHIPSNQPRFTKLAKEIVGNETNAYKAADKISRYVFGIMTTDASIGVLRNANEVLDTKVGVCRDYAILAATLMRAVGLPTRLVSGLIYEGDRFYYHAWVEVFTGERWMPFDPTRATRPFDATHLKLAQGNVEEGFTFTVLSGAKIEVREVIYNQ